MKNIKNQKGFVGALEVIIITVIVAIVGYGGYRILQRNKDGSGQKTNSALEKSETKSWQTGEVAIGGKYADADAVDLGNGKYRMYYSIEPEVAGNQLEMYSATSTDGIIWTKESGIRKTFAPFPSVLKLPNGKWRLYFQNTGVIKSALSSDGLNWSDEAGTRMDATNSLGLKFDNVAAPTVDRLSDGNYIMVYRGFINDAYSNETPNKNTQLFLWASSKDGLNWTKKGMAIDSRNSTLQGLVDGPEIVPKWDDGTVKLFFWSYSGVYESTYSEGKFSQPALVYSGQNTNAQNKFPMNPPGDPTLLKVNGTWYMYYGQHTKGIYSAILK